MNKSIEILKRNWDQIMDGEPLPALTESVMNTSGYWPIIFIIIFTLNIFVAKKKENLAFHILLLSIFAEIIILIGTFLVFVLPFIAIDNKLS